MRRALLILGAASLAATACGGDATATSASTSAATTLPGPSTQVTPATTVAATTTMPHNRVVVSDDGAVTIEVPAAAVDGDPGITVVTREIVGSGLEDVAGALVGPVYDMGPPALSFASPVRVTREIPVEELGDLPDDAVPLLLLVTTGPDGSGELLTDQRITRDGDIVRVSGDTTHFSPLGVVGEQVHLRVRIADVARTDLSQLGLEWALFDPAGNAYSAPSDAIPSIAFPGGSQVEATISGPNIDVTSAAFGVVTGEFSLQLALRALERDSGASLLALPSIIGLDDQDARITMSVMPRLAFPDPDDIIAGRPVSIGTFVDHQGGQVVIPDGDFRGGLSGGLILIEGDLPPGALVTYIQDSNFNGALDGLDTIFPPQPTGPGPDGTTQAVVPLIGFSPNYVVVIDGTKFDSDLLFTEQIPVLGAIPFIGAAFRGETSPEFSVSVVGVGGVPFIWDVGPQEASQLERDAELLIFMTSRLVDDPDAEP